MFNRPTNITKPGCDCNNHNHNTWPPTEHHHGFIQQCINNALMHDFNPCDPANKSRTFEKMVRVANLKHLNPGEMSFHYYIDIDNKVHGFIAIGNINDRLPHIIISDTGQEQSMFSILTEVEKMVTEILIDKSGELESFKDDVNAQLAEFKKVVEKIDVDEITEQLAQFSKEFNDIKDEVNTTIADANAAIKDVNDKLDEIGDIKQIVVDEVSQQINEQLEGINDTINITIDDKIKEEVVNLKDDIESLVDDKIDDTFQEKIDKVIEDKQLITSTNIETIIEEKQLVSQEILNNYISKEDVDITEITDSIEANKNSIDELSDKIANLEQEPNESNTEWVEADELFKELGFIE